MQNFIKCAFFFISLSLALQGMAFCQPQAGETILLTPGSNCVILTPSQPTEIETQAGKMLASMFKKVLGTSFEFRPDDAVVAPGSLIISIGNTKTAGKYGLARLLQAKPSDSILISVDAHNRVICLLGVGDLGAYFAAATFLQKFAGVRWYFPGELGLVAPPRDRLEIPAGHTVESPCFPMRWIGRSFAKEWALFNKMNTNLIDEKGVNVYKSAHTFHGFLPPAKYFLSHPEYYALRRGVRIPKQLCTSNPKVVELVADAIVRLTDEQPYLDIVTLFPEDGLHFCECDNCLAHDDPGEIGVREINKKWVKLGAERGRALSRRMTDFYIAVAEKVRLAKPDVLIQAGAYSAYSYPPRNYARKAPRNVFIYMTHGGCHNHPLTSASCPVNARFLEAMAGWKQIFAGVTIYEYYRKLVNIDLPFPIIHSIRQDIPQYRSMGVYGLFSQFNKDYYISGLNYFIAANLLWDTKCDVDVLMEQFFADFYGAAASPMKRYWLGFEEHASKINIHLATDFSGLIRLYDEDFLSTQESYLKEAIISASDPLVRKRINRASIEYQYVVMVMEYLRYARETAQRGKSRERLEQMESMVRNITLHRKKFKNEEIFGGGKSIVKRISNPQKVIDHFRNAT